MLSDLDFRGSGELRSDHQGHPISKNRDFTQFDSEQSLLHASTPLLEAVRPQSGLPGHRVVGDEGERSERWGVLASGVSSGGASERSELTAGRRIARVQ